MSIKVIFGTKTNIGSSKKNKKSKWQICNFKKKEGKMKPKYPTHNDEVIAWLKEKGSITAWDAFNFLYVLDLAGVIRDLKEDYNIDSEWVYKTNCYGRPIKYKRYIFKGIKRLTNK